MVQHEEFDFQVSYPLSELCLTANWQSLSLYNELERLKGQPEAIWVLIARSAFEQARPLLDEIDKAVLKEVDDYWQEHWEAFNEAFEVVRKINLFPGSTPNHWWWHRLHGDANEPDIKATSLVEW